MSLKKNTIFELKRKTTNNKQKLFDLFQIILMEYSTHGFIHQTPISEQNFELK